MHGIFFPCGVLCAEYRVDEKVREAIEKRLLGEQRKEAQDRWLARLKKTAIIKRYM